MLEMENAEAMQNILDRFEECPRIIQMFKTKGGYNLRCSKGIRSSEFYPVSETYFSPFLSNQRKPCPQRKQTCPMCRWLFTLQSVWK